MPKKTCKDPNKIKNPRTNYCVKKDGAIGRRIQGKEKKYMDTPALRAAIAKEKARGKKAFTMKKKKKKASGMEYNVWYSLRKNKVATGMLLKFTSGMKAEIFKDGKIHKGKVEGELFKKDSGGSIDMTGLKPKKSKVQPKLKAKKPAEKPKPKPAEKPAEKPSESMFDMTDSEEEEEEHDGSFYRTFSSARRKLKKGDKIKIFSGTSSGEYRFYPAVFEREDSLGRVFISGSKAVDGVYTSMSSLTWKFENERGYRGKEPPNYQKNRFVDYDDDMGEKYKDVNPKPKKPIGARNGGRERTYDYDGGVTLKVGKTYTYIDEIDSGDATRKPKQVVTKMKILKLSPASFQAKVWRPTDLVKMGDSQYGGKRRMEERDAVKQTARLTKKGGKLTGNVSVGGVSLYNALGKFDKQ